MAVVIVTVVVVAIAVNVTAAAASTPALPLGSHLLADENISRFVS